MADSGIEKSVSEGGRDEWGLALAQRTWLEHIQQCEAEGLTYKAYCKREGLKVGGLYAARKKLRDVELTGSAPASSEPPPRFAAVRLAHRDEIGTVEVLCPNGVQMRITLHDVDGVVRLVRGLGQLSK